MPDNKAIIKAFYERFDRWDIAAMTRMVAPNFASHVPGVAATQDWETFIKWSTAFYTAIPDGRHDFAEIIAEGDKVVTVGAFGGTHRATLMGVPPTGKRLKFAVIHVDRLENGKIVDHQGVADFLSLQQQLGIAPGAH